MQEVNLMKKKAGSLLAWDPTKIGTSTTLSNNNKRSTMLATTTSAVRSTLGKTTGKWYTELKIIQVQSGWSGGATPSIGIGSQDTPVNNPTGAGPDEIMLYSWAPSNCVCIYQNGKSFGYNAYATAGAIIGVGLDLDNNTLRFYPSGTLANLINLASYTTLGKTFYLFAAASGAGGTSAIVDIQDTLTYQIPSGFQRW